MNETIQRLMKQIEERGGKVHVSGTLPDEMTEIFLRQILECPDCKAHDAQGRSKMKRGH
jgi:hypothetical protein